MCTTMLSVSQMRHMLLPSGALSDQVLLETPKSAHSALMRIVVCTFQM